MNKILVVDDMAIFREPIAASLRLHGYATFCASDGQQALAIVKAERPDLIVLDVAMPVMNGLTFLKRLREHPESANTPVIILSAISQRESVMTTAQYGAKAYLLKSRFRLVELLERIRKQLQNVAPAEPAANSEPSGEPATPAAPVAAAVGVAGVAVAKRPAAPIATIKDVPQLLTTEECTRRAENALQAKTLSGVVTQVLQLVSSPRSDMTQLASLIGRDSLLAAGVLRTANSSAYASTRGVVMTIPDAVKNIGCAGVRNIAAALGVFDAMPASSSDGFNFIRCWQHSFAVAQLCERLYSSVDPEGAGTAYLVGLCHDLGEILMQTEFAGELRKVQEAQLQTNLPREELERAVLGMTHADLTRMIFKRLGLPETIRRPVELFYASQRKSEPTAPKDPLARVLWMAEGFANSAMLAASDQSIVYAMPGAAFKETLAEFNPSRPDISQLRSEIVSMTAMLARLSAKEEEQLMTPLFGPSEARFWLMRDRHYSSFDPIATLLETIATVTIEDRLPTPDEIAQHDGLILMTPGTVTADCDLSVIQALLARAPAGFPAFWLTEQTDMALPIDAITIQKSPATIAQIAAFVRQVADGKAKLAAAA
jgi:HD-like signal output (HDOD) protein/CheY-like chemotaxis protein